MRIYDEPVWKLMREMAEDFGLRGSKSFARSDAIKWFKKHYPKIKIETIRAHLTTLSTNSPSRVHHNAGRIDDFFYQIDRYNFRLYNRRTDPPPIYGDGSPTQDEVEDEDTYNPNLGDRRNWEKREVASRPGQGKFKKLLIKRHGASCQVTGCRVMAVIEAAHINPFRGEDDDNPQNGLLLRADIHTLFDRDLLGIEPGSLKICIHPDIEKNYGKLKGKILRFADVHRPSKLALDLRFNQYQEKLGKSKLVVCSHLDLVLL
jgi:hypothetical protein